MAQDRTLRILVKLWEVMRSQRPGQRPARLGRWGRAASQLPVCQWLGTARSCIARPDGCGGERAARAARRLVAGCAYQLAEVRCPAIRAAVGPTEHRRCRSETRSTTSLPELGTLAVRLPFASVDIPPLTRTTRTYEAPGGGSYFVGPTKSAAARGWRTRVVRGTAPRVAPAIMAIAPPLR